MNKLSQIDKLKQKISQFRPLSAIKELEGI